MTTAMLLVLAGAALGTVLVLLVAWRGVQGILDKLNNRDR